MGQCRFTSCNKCAIVVQDVDNMRGCKFTGTGGVWEVSTLSTQFFSEPKTDLKQSTLKITLFENENTCGYVTRFNYNSKHNYISDSFTL